MNLEKLIKVNSTLIKWGNDYFSNGWGTEQLACVSWSCFSFGYKTHCRGTTKSFGVEENWFIIKNWIFLPDWTVSLARERSNLTINLYESLNKTTVASTDSHCSWPSALTWTSVIWTYAFVVNYSVKIQLALILVVAVKDTRKSCRVTSISVSILMNAKMRELVLEVQFAGIWTEITIALVTLGLQVKHVRILTSVLSATRHVMLTLIVTIRQEASNVLVEKVFSEQVKNVRRASVRIRCAPKTRDVRPWLRSTAYAKTVSSVVSMTLVLI